MKQLGFAPAQLVQKPTGLSLQVPCFAGPAADPMGSRKALPSGVNVILNRVPVGVAAVNGSPLKKAALISLGRIASAPRARVGTKPSVRTTVRKSMFATATFYDTIPRLAAVQEISPLESVIGLVAAGVGIANVPSVARKFKIAEVVFRPIRERFATVNFAMAWRKHDPSPVVRAFVDMVEKLE